jgi:hypothetical protein
MWSIGNLREESVGSRAVCHSTLEGRRRRYRDIAIAPLTDLSTATRQFVIARRPAAAPRPAMMHDAAPAELRSGELRRAMPSDDDLIVVPNGAMLLLPFNASRLGHADEPLEVSYAVPFEPSLGALNAA